ncbi:MAG TPA: HepT-like ribonuclease domain-containing protein [Tepidisphaeraceae bacterium]|nr:HepT-like ribonuclease domain-containing protein [Tepidisphaeraceae bacterium]
MRTDRMLLHDILDAIAEVQDVLPATQHEFDSNKLVSTYVLRHIQIIGEAAWRLSDALKASHSEVPWKGIAGMRHVLVHDYFEVNWQRVYETARDNVPPLKAQIEAILALLPPDPAP